MSELCEVHKIVAAPDGRCVLCRRPKLDFAVDDEGESAASKAVTAILGMGLIATVCFAAYTFAVAGAETSTQPMRRAAVTRSAEPLAPQPLAAATSELEAPATSPAQPAVQAPLIAPPVRVRTVGQRIVDPRLIEARRRVRVTMYSAPWCFICDRARSFLDAREVDLVDYDVDVDTAAERRLQQINNTGSIPTFVVDGKTIVGFHPWGLEDAIDAVAQRHYCSDDQEAAVCERLASAR